MANRNIFYNFCLYIENQFPAEIIFRNARIKIHPAKSVPARNILIRDTGGIQTGWSEFATKTVQIITRDKAAPKAYELSQEIFDEIQDRFGLILPVEIIDGVTYPEIQSAQITNTTMPQFIGADEHGWMEVSANYKIIYNRDTEH
jgi:hypothetical protein